MLSLLTEEPLSLTQAAKIIPGCPARGTVQRWATAGVKGVVLPTFRVGGRRWTNRELIEQFIDQLGRNDHLVTASRSLDKQRAEAILKSVGV